MMSLNTEDNRIVYDKPKFTSYQLTAVIFLILAIIVIFTFKSQRDYYQSTDPNHSGLYWKYGIDERALLMGSALIVLSIFLLSYSRFRAVKHFELSIANGNLNYVSNRKSTSIKLSDISKIFVAKNEPVHGRYATSQAPMGYITVFSKGVSVEKLLNISLPELSIDLVGLSEWMRGHLAKEGFNNITVEIPGGWRFGGA